MLLDRQPWSTNAALLRTAVLLELDGEGRQSVLDQILNDDGCEVTRSEIVYGSVMSNTSGPTGVRPHCYWAFTRNAGHQVFLGGATTRTRTQAIVDMLADPPDTYLNDRSPFVGPYDGGAAALAALPPFSDSRDNDTTITGYSLGGAVGFWLIQKILEVYGRTDFTKLCTFGMPKPYRYDKRPGFTSFNQCHWFLSDDPVRIVPPDLTFYQRFVAGFSRFQAARMSGYVSVGNSWEILKSGQGRYRAEPSELGPDPVQAIRDWIALAESGTPTSHSLTTYQARIIANGGRLPDEVDQYVPDSGAGGTGGGSDDHPPTSTTPQIISPILTNSAAGVIQQEYAQTIFRVARDQTAAPVIIPPAQQFSTYRSGKVWFVQFGDTTFAVGPHKRGARQLARAGNAMLRSMQARGGISAADLESAWNAYLGAAANPADGFQPLMVPTF